MELCLLMLIFFLLGYGCAMFMYGLVGPSRHASEAFLTGSVCFLVGGLLSFVAMLF